MKAATNEERFKQRVVQIAQNKLRALETPTFFNRERQLLGRIRIEPSQYASIPGITLEEVHTFLVLGHDRIAFVDPSLLRFVGSITFFDAVDRSDFESRVRTSWDELVERTRLALARVRQYFSGVFLDPETWSLIVLLSGEPGTTRLRVLVRGDRVGLELLELDGTPWDADRLGAFGTWLDEDPVLHDASVTEALLRKARHERSAALEKSEQVGEVDLGKFGYDASLSGPSIDLVYEEADKSGEDRDHPTYESPRAQATDASGASSASGASQEAQETSPQPMVPVASRLPRLRVAQVRASVSWPTPPEGASAGGDSAVPAHRSVLSVSVVDLTLHGLFLSAPEEGAPAPGTEVTVEGDAGITLTGRVVHVRSAAEGALLKTGSGFGVQLVSGPGLAASNGSTERSASRTTPVLVMVDDKNLRRSVTAALAETSTRALLLAHNPLDAVSFLHALPIGQVVMSPRFGDADWASVGNALGLPKLGLRVVVISDVPLENAPAWVRTIHPQQISPRSSSSG